LFASEDDGNGGCSIEPALDGGVVDDRGLLRRYGTSNQAPTIHACYIETSNFLHYVRPVDAYHHGALSTAGIGGVESGFDDFLQGGEGYLLGGETTNGTSIFNEFE
jgi:hypothetical protein